ncbi:50S ribosomal protein L24e [Candidatus Woesearchaeota archaeon]|nr:50S ribosomal protein L24e [Candidatus Woesearchaeota archaeon]
MAKCTFSGEEIEPGTGITYITKEGKVLFFKNKKCEKNFIKLKRKPITTKWSKRYQK